MTVLLTRPYVGYPAGQIVELATAVESALIAQGLATSTASIPTSGAYSTTAFQGVAVVPAAASSVVISNPSFDPGQKFFAVIAQAAADATALYVARVVVASGTLTIYLNAAATAATVVDWSILTPFGTTM